MSTAPSPGAPSTSRGSFQCQDGGGYTLLPPFSNQLARVPTRSRSKAVSSALQWWPPPRSTRPHLGASTGATWRSSYKGRQAGRGGGPRRPSFSCLRGKRLLQTLQGGGVPARAQDWPATQGSSPCSCWLIGSAYAAESKLADEEPNQLALRGPAPRWRRPAAHLSGEAATCQAQIQTRPPYLTEHTAAGLPRPASLEAPSHPAQSGPPLPFPPRMAQPQPQILRRGSQMVWISCNQPSPPPQPGGHPMPLFRC